jgi:hypothetical protein
MTKTQFLSAEKDIIHQLAPITNTLRTLSEGRGTVNEVEDWNEYHEMEDTLYDALFDLRNDFAFSQSTGIIAISTASGSMGRVFAVE